VGYLRTRGCRLPAPKPKSPLTAKNSLKFARSGATGGGSGGRHLALNPLPLTTLSRAELAERAQRAREILRSCTLCERRCGINRAESEAAPCGLNHQTRCFKRHVSYAEEVDLLPSYMVYLGGCNFRCRFCVQAPRCFDPAGGVRIDPQDAALDFGAIVARGAKTINLLGGEPSLHLHTLLEIAASAEETLPLVLNSNMYMTPEVIELLDGVVAAYIADFKFGNDVCASKLAGIDRYWEVVTRNLQLVDGRTEILLRHLVMPGHLECCLVPVARWIGERMRSTPVTLMTGYVPAWRARGGEMGRCLTDEEITRARGIALDHGLNCDMS
jgi:putative pyruvate formate lyase activating enzyme